MPIVAVQHHVLLAVVFGICLYQIRVMMFGEIGYIELEGADKSCERIGAEIASLDCLWCLPNVSGRQLDRLPCCRRVRNPASATPAPCFSALKRTCACTVLWHIYTPSMHA